MHVIKHFRMILILAIDLALLAILKHLEVVETIWFKKHLRLLMILVLQFQKMLLTGNLDAMTDL